QMDQVVPEPVLMENIRLVADVLGRRDIHSGLRFLEPLLRLCDLLLQLANARIVLLKTCSIPAAHFATHSTSLVCKRIENASSILKAHPLGLDLIGCAFNKQPGKDARR